MSIYFCCATRHYTCMEKKVRNIAKKKKPKQSEKDSIAELKKKIKHQKDALNKIIKTFSK